METRDLSPAHTELSPSSWRLVSNGAPKFWSVRNFGRPRSYAELAEHIILGGGEMCISTHLRTATIQLNAITLALDMLGCLEKCMWVIATKLNDERPVFWMWIEIVLAIGFLHLNERRCVR